MNPDVVETIRAATESNTKPGQIFTSLRVRGGETLLVSKRDIYNVRQLLRQQALGPLTAIQALLQHLDNGQWQSDYKRNEANQVTDLFFIRNDCLELLRDNYEVILMDCTYKTNRYKLPLLLIQRVTCFYSTFFIGYVFLSDKTEESYQWALEKFQAKCVAANIPDHKVAVTDNEQALKNTLKTVYPEAYNLLCIWHVNKNVLIRLKEEFEYQDDLEACLTDWNKVLYAPTVDNYKQKWQDFLNAYEQEHPDLINYLFDVWLAEEEKIIRCYTNRIRHWELTVTSRVEGSHALLKRRLEPRKETSRRL